jgi:signal transduction histidine kinase/ligand-binding sensor domain-containing protein
VRGISLFFWTASEPSTSKPPLLRMCSYFCLVLSMCAADGQANRWPVPLARVDPRPIKLSIVDGTDIRFARPFAVQELSQTRVSGIVQDNQGFMWFGTQHGLNRYDGYAFKVFVHDPKKLNSLGGVTTRALFKDRDGVLWVGCEQFLNKFEPASETFTRYAIPFVRHISQDRDGLLWLSTATGLRRLDPATGRVRLYSHDPNDPSSLSNNDVEASGEDREGRFWVASHSNGLDEFDRASGKVILHIPLGEPVGAVSFYEDRLGQFWILNGWGPQVLSLFERKTNTLRKCSLLEARSSHTPLTGITAMLEDQNGNLWLATHGAGLLKLDRDRQRFIRYRNHLADPDSLPQDNAENLFSDREGGIWAGLGRMGPVRFSPRPLPFRRLPHDPDSSNPTAEPFVGAIYEDHDGILWTGTPDALNRIDRANGRYTAIRQTPGRAMDVITIREDRSGNIWAGTYGHGLHCFDQRTSKFKIYRHNPADPYSLSSDIVMRLLVDHKGTLWVGTIESLNRFDPSTARFSTYRPNQQGESLSYHEIVEDQDGALWLGTEFSGLYRFDAVTGQFTAHYQHDVNGPETLSDNRVNSVHIDRMGGLWVGTQNGLNKLDRKTGKFEVYTRGDGLPDNAVGCVLEDGSGNLWMSTNRGVARFDKQTKTFTSYSSADGLPGLDLTGWGACFQSPSGELFFGGFSGATAFYPNLIGAEYTPPIVFTEFELSGNRVGIGGDSPLRESISSASKIVLSHKQSVFSLTFAGLSYSNPGTNRYRYRLEGLQRDWTETGSDRRQATYTTLPAGEYTFRAQAATSRGPWNDPGAVLRIKILPPWWATAWFSAIAVAGAAAGFWVLYRFRVRELSARMQSQMEERLGERARIARDLHDTLLQSFHGLLFRFQAVDNLLPSRPGEAKQTLESAIDDAAQAITEARDAVHELRSSTVVTNDLAAAVTALGEELAAHHTTGAASQDSPTFLVEVEGTPQDLHPILRDEIYRIAGEAVRNAFRHAKARRIEVEIRYYERELRVQIRDDGSGIDPGILSHEGRAGHWGLPGMRERAKRIGGQMDLWSELGVGTEVELRIPASIAYRAYAGRRFRLFRKKTGTSS